MNAFSPSDKNEETQYTVGECFFSLEQCLKFLLACAVFWEEKKKSFGQVSEIPFSLLRSFFVSSKENSGRCVYAKIYIKNLFNFL